MQVKVNATQVEATSYQNDDERMRVSAGFVPVEGPPGSFVYVEATLGPNELRDFVPMEAVPMLITRFEEVLDTLVTALKDETTGS